MAKPTKQKRENEPQIKRQKMLASHSFRKKVKDSIELIRTYRINVHNEFTLSKEYRNIAKSLAEHISFEDTRNRYKTDNEEISFDQISNQPQKL